MPGKNNRRRNRSNKTGNQNVKSKSKFKKVTNSNFKKVTNSYSKERINIKSKDSSSKCA